MTQSKLMHSTATVLFFTAMTLAISTPVLAIVDVGQQVVLNFTQPDRIKQMAHWTDEHYINSTKDGLGWDGKAQEYRDVAIETVEPTAVGWSWKPATTVFIATEVIPSGKFRFHKTGVTFPTTAGVLFARYSPDGKHWSTWQALEPQRPRDKEHPRLWLQGTLRVPRKARQRYAKLLREFAGTDRPIGVDEETAVRWILEKQPDFFKHELPFIGYVEFLYETSIQGNQRLKRLNINLSYWRGGRISIPPGHRENEQWRFKTSGSLSSAVVDVNDRTGPMLDKLANYAWGEKLDGLRIGISPVKPYQQNDKTRFNVTLQNVGKKDLVLNLGMMLANGKYQYATAVKLIFTDQNGKSYEFHNNLGRRPGIAGRVDPFVVPLAVGCTYVLRVDFDNYWFVPVGTSLPKGQYRVAAIFEGKAVDHTNLDMEGISLMPYWTGVIKSKELLFKNTRGGSALQKPNSIVFQKGKR